ncbi:hypothetical protein GCM10016455_17700 [Aliiroseovarius zhejiangensis]|uniref:HEAT repeat domain-containing protein n=1 Tax=Aliiroseovarius zhejiangensis TaxID=1632025 RepID=A0ABQ3J0I2_9RHOB|nr:hypothetical protein [Aliiroseovarius zhejiangensis]GHE97645.1 hypothetical protein GCM10016455_17700 [Aliiroseovarius zhejiangensis]
MRLWTAICFLLICWPASLSARDITVKAGEHDRFSRLVVYTTPADSPVLTRHADGFRFTSGDRADRFTTQGVFDMIPRDRIQNLTSPGEGVLNIVVACPCDVVTQTLPTGQFVIDIVDTPARPETPSAQTGKSDAERPYPGSVTNARDARRGLPIAVRTGTDNPLVLPEPETQEATKATTSLTVSEATSPLPLNEKDLLTQLARAASQGLVDAPSPLPPAEVETASQTRRAEPATHPPPTARTKPPTPADHIRVQTSVDRDRVNAATSTETFGDGAACLASSTFAIGDWGRGDEGPLDFAVYRASLMTELDRLDPTRFRAYIQHQLHLTFGAEVLSYLDRYRGILPDDADLRLMAEIIETGVTADHARMSTQLACEGSVALWAVLAQPRLPRDQPINTAAVIAAFSSLPRHLRLHLGPMVMRKFLAIGDTDTSMELNRITQRGSDQTANAVTLADAQLKLETGQEPQGRNQLAEIVDADDHDAIDAILLLIENHIATQSGIPERTLELLSSLAHEHGAAGRGSDLAIAEVRALIHMSRFTDARVKLRNFDSFPDRGDDRHVLIVNEFGRALAKSAADSTFLRHVIGQPFWPDASEDTRILIATRLLDLGFASAAKDMLTNQPAPPGRAARVLIARAALQNGQAKVALGYLSGLNGETAQSLRKSALRATGQMTEPDAPTAPPAPVLSDGSGNEISLEAYDKLIEGSKAIRANIDLVLNPAPTS